jgi:hypothetical protein
MHFPQPRLELTLDPAAEADADQERDDDNAELDRHPGIEEIFGKAVEGVFGPAELGRPVAPKDAVQGHLPPSRLISALAGGKPPKRG